MDNNFNMTFEESQDYIAKRGFDIPWNDCDVFVDEREINRTVGNVLKWADKTMIEKACEVLKNHLFTQVVGRYDGEHSQFIQEVYTQVFPKFATAEDMIMVLRKEMEE
jgi:hypothetical protein